MTAAPREWLDTLGAGARVLVLDSGLLPTQDLVVAEARNFTRTQMDDGATHGTAMARLVASRDPLGLGAAPYCHLYIAKVVTAGPARWSVYEEALQWGLDLAVDVVSMSFAVAAVSRGFTDLIAELDGRRAICCAAYSPRSWAVKDPHILNVRLPRSGNGPGAPMTGEVFLRAAGGQPRPLRGTSVSCALMAGLAACAKSKEPGIDRPGFLARLSDLNSSWCTPCGRTTGPSSHRGGPRTGP